MQAYLRLPDGSRDELYLQYYVRFQPDFDFVRGGKLPGSVRRHGDRRPEHPGRHRRVLHPVHVARRRRRRGVRVPADLRRSHGTSLGRGLLVLPGEPVGGHQQRVKLNTPGASDGEVTVWQDGRQVFVQRGMTYRTTDQLKIDGVFFSTFFGGGDESWASPVDQYADFAGFSVSPSFVPPPGGSAADPLAPPDGRRQPLSGSSVPAPS